MARVLICEDEHIVALDIKRHLVRFGYEVSGPYATGEEGIEACAADKPDLVLMDIRLQGRLDGIESARAIFDRFDVPVILLTAYADSETVSRAKDSRPFGYVIKPFDDKELRTAIEMALYRHLMDRKLRASEERYRNLFEAAPSANLTATPDGVVTDCNAAFAALLGWPGSEDALGTHLADRFANRAEGESFLEKIAGGTAPSVEEWTLLGKDGKIVQALATVSLGKGDDGRLEELRIYLVDVTERKELESQLRQAQKMEAVGRLAGGVAHDFNNIITAIMGYCNLLAEDVGENAALRGEVEGIQTAARKAVNLTRQLLAFSRKQPLDARAMDANAALADLEKMARRLVSENIIVKFFLEAKRPRVLIDPGQFEQILINLVVNAKDALPGDGSIVIETANVVADGSGKHHGVPAGDWFVLSVRDSGAGIAPENLQRIFEPFFTTKGLERGTGLGLSTVYANATRNGGRVAVESEIGKGTCFFVYLPVSIDEADRGAPPAAPAVPEPTPQAKGQAVLLTEDDDYLRNLLSRLLSKIGYRVFEASNPGEAILIAERERDFILLTDVVMPRMSGYELADRLAAERKDLRVIFMSGYNDKREGPSGAAYGKSAFLQKPFSHQQLMDVLALFN